MVSAPALELGRLYSAQHAHAPAAAFPAIVLLGSRLLQAVAALCMRVPFPLHLALQAATAVRLMCFHVPLTCSTPYIQEVSHAVLCVLRWGWDYKKNVQQKRGI